MTNPQWAASHGPRSSFERVRAALDQGGFRVTNARSNEFFATCPVHEERTGSLHVTWRSRPDGGFTLLKCFGCDADAQTLAEGMGLSLTDLFDEPRPEPVRVGKSPARRKAGQRRGKLGRLPARIAVATPAPPAVDHDYRVTTTYDYVAIDGRVVQRVLREECHCDGTHHKQFRQEFRAGDGTWRKRKSSIPGFAPTLYNAAAVAQARRTGELVHITEGEKDADRLTALGLVATTNAEGANSVPEQLLDDLRDLAVWVHVDRDEAGYRRGALLYRELSRRGCQVELRMPAILQSKSDVSDHLDAEFGIDDLVPVSVEELEAWILHGALATQTREVRVAIEQAHAQQERAESEPDAQDPSPDERRRWALRWVLESQIRQEAASETAQRVYVQARVAGTSWAFEAMQQSERLMAAATDDARRLHEEFGVAIPGSLRPATADDDAANDEDPSAPDHQAHADVADRPGRPASGARSKWSAFRVLNDQIVEWVPSRGRARPRDDADDEDESQRDGSFKTLLSMVVKLTVREYLETGDDTTHESPLMGRAMVPQPVTPRQLVAVRLAYADPLSGELMEIRVSADTWRDHSWLDSLPGAPDYDHRRTGLDQLQRAIIAISDDVVDQVLHTSTGWRQLDDGRMGFVHARGVITADGHERAGVQLSGSTRRYDWPDPIRDPAELRQAWINSGWGLVRNLPARVAVPVMGSAFRAVLGWHNPWVVALIGPPGSYKTSVASQVMHFFGERWDRDKPASSMSGNGDTLNAIRNKLHFSQDVLYWMDDFAPTKSWLEAQKLLEETARLIHNAEERARSSRDGLSVSDGTGPRAAGLMTSEVMPRPGSGAERMLVVPITKDDVSTATLFPLAASLHRHQRALVMASFVSWLAADHDLLRGRYEGLTLTFAEQLAAAGETVRQAEALASVWVGWVAMLDFLLAAHAITEAERQQAMAIVKDAVVAAGQAAINPDMPRTTGERVKELLGYALRQGIAYVDDVRTGDCPPWPLAKQLGWRRTVLDQGDSDGFGRKVRFDRMGVSLGYVRHDPGPKESDGRVLMCDSTQIEAVLRAAGSTQTERLEIDRTTACKALAEAQVLLFEEEKGTGKVRYTKKCELYAEGSTRRMVLLRLDAILGSLGDEDDEPASPPPGDGGPTTSAHDQDVDQHLLPPSPVGVEGHSVEGVSGSGHTESGTAASGQSEEPHQPDETEEDALMTQHPDRDGIIGLVEHPGDRAPCDLCGIVCAIVIDGMRIHLPCWWRSSAAERAAARSTPTDAAERTSAPSPAAAAVIQPAVRKRPSEKSFRTAAAVADVDGLWLSDGTMKPWPGGTLPRHVGDLYEAATSLQLGTRATPYYTNIGQIWVTAGLLAELGINPSDMLAAKPADDRSDLARAATRGQPVVIDAIAAGYGIGGGADGGDCLGRWTRIWKADANDDAVWIVLIPAYRSGEDLDKAELPFTHDDPEPATLARRIGKLADTLSFAFQIHPGHTGLDMLKAVRLKDRNRLFVVHEAIPPARTPNNEVDQTWARTPTEEENRHAYVHAYDRGGSHVAGATGLDLPIGTPEHHPEGRAFDPKQAGYWRVEIPESWDWRLPNPLDPTSQQWGRRRWATTPTLQFAVQQGYEPEIIEAYTWAESSRVLDPWYERIRDARTALDTEDPDDQVARSQLKQIYTRTLGLMASSVFMAGKPMYQPEWREFVVAKANMNVLRRIVTIGKTTGRWPVAVEKDTIVYTSPERDPEKAWPGGEQWFGRGMGQYKPEGSALLEDHLKFLTPGPYRGKGSLTKDELR